LKGGRDLFHRRKRFATWSESLSANGKGKREHNTRRIKKKGARGSGPEKVVKEHHLQNRGRDPKGGPRKKKKKRRRMKKNYFRGVQNFNARKGRSYPREVTKRKKEEHPRERGGGNDL